jgi:hypothetical protein
VADGVGRQGTEHLDERRQLGDHLVGGADDQGVAELLVVVAHGPPGVGGLPLLAGLPAGDAVAGAAGLGGLPGAGLALELAEAGRHDLGGVLGGHEREGRLGDGEVAAGGLLGGPVDAALQAAGPHLGGDVAVGVAAGPAHGGLDEPAHPHGRAAVLEGQGAGGHDLVGVEHADAGHLAGGGLAQHPDALEQPGDPLAAVRPEALELDVAVAGAEPEDEPAAAELVDDRRLLGEADRVPHGGEEDVGADGDALGPLGDGGQGDQRRGEVAVGAEVVLAGPHGVEAVLLGEDGVLHDVAQRPVVAGGAGVGGVGREAAQPERQPGLHRTAMRGRVGHDGSPPWKKPSKC